MATKAEGMKLRVICINGLYAPQYQKKSYYGTRWNAYGEPGIKFVSKTDALDFIKIVEKSIQLASKPNKSIVYQNFQEPQGKGKLKKVVEKEDSTINRAINIEL